MNAMAHRADIDGLRAYAVIPVILFHCDKHWLPGGFLGVDVFFVISGFLITSIILRELDADLFSLSRFWARRIRRILPNLILVTCATLATTWLFVFKADRVVIGRQAIAALCSVANIYFWQAGGDYWSQEANWAPFLHAWSLSVEEQFYALFPLLLLGVHRCARWAVPWVILVVLVASLAAYIYGANHHPVATFYLLPTRAWEMAAGGLWAHLSRRYRSGFGIPVIGDALAILGMGMILVAYFEVFPAVVSTVAAVIGACLTIAAGGSRAAAVFLGNPIAVGIGRISYGLYLWHQPLLVLGRDLGWGGRVDLLLAATVALAVCGFYLVENPVRYMPNAVPRTLAALAATAAAAFCMATTPTFYDTQPLLSPVFFGMYYDTNPHPTSAAHQSETFRGVTVPRRPIPGDAFRSQGILVGSSEGSPRVVLLGDSLGAMWGRTVEQIVRDRELPASLWCMNAVSPFVTIPMRGNRGNAVLTDDQRQLFDQARLDMIHKWQPDLVIVAALWSDARASQPNDLIDFLCANAKQVLILEQPPEAVRRGRSMMQYICYLGLQRDALARGKTYLPAANVQAHARGRELVRQLAQRHGNCAVVPVADLFLSDGKVRVLEGADPLYVDATHLSEVGVESCTARLAAAVDHVLARHGGNDK